MFIQSLIEKSAEAKLGHVLVDYDVPLKKEVGKGSLKAANWPKGFYVRGLRPPGRGTTRATSPNHWLERPTLCPPRSCRLQTKK
jgi:hypothetical protein